jgi:hypothetical protein
MENIKIIEGAASFEINKNVNNLTINEIDSWLKEKEILNVKSNLISYEDILKWEQKGSETYITIFNISFSFENQILEKQIVIKAIITLNPEKSLSMWNERRQILQLNKVPVSNWYWYGKGIIIEDFYPYTFEYANLNSLAFIAYKLDLLGFHTLSFLHDIRCGFDKLPYYNDFGFDLGSFGNQNNNIAVNSLIKHFNDKESEINFLINKFSTNE